MESVFSRKSERSGLSSNSLLDVLTVLEQLPPPCLQRMELSLTLHSGTRSLRILCSELISAAALISPARDLLGMPRNLTSIVRIPTSPETYLVLHVRSGNIRESLYQVQIHYGMCVGTWRTPDGRLSHSEIGMDEYATTQVEKVGTTVLMWKERWDSIRISRYLEAIISFNRAITVRSHGLMIITRNANV